MRIIYLEEYRDNKAIYEREVGVRNERALTLGYAGGVPRVFFPLPHQVLCPFLVRRVACQVFAMFFSLLLPPPP